MIITQGTQYDCHARYKQRIGTGHVGYLWLDLDKSIYLSIWLNVHWDHGSSYDKRRCYSRFSPVMWSKLKIVTIQWIKSRIWHTVDDCYINNLAKNQVSAVPQSRVICRSVSPKIYRALYGDAMFVHYWGVQIMAARRKPFHPCVI